MAYPPGGVSGRSTLKGRHDASGSAGGRLVEGQPPAGRLRLTYIFQEGDEELAVLPLHQEQQLIFSFGAVYFGHQIRHRADGLSVYF